MSLGIPYAPVSVTSTGTVQTCPVCGERCETPRASYDQYGEHAAPDAYQTHYAAAHGARARGEGQ